MIGQISYRVVSKNGKWAIIEDSTGLTVQMGAQREMNRICKKLNKGSGFTGFTPTFFVETSRRVIAA